MDQQQLTTLDPKLREAYERVMGLNAQPKAQTAVNTPGPSQPASQTNPNDQPLSDEKPFIQDLSLHSKPAEPIPTAQTPIPQHPLQDNPLQTRHETPAPTVNNNPTPMLQHQEQPATDKQNEANPGAKDSMPVFDPIVANNQMHAYVAQEVAGAKQSIKTIQMIYVIGGLVFFVVYAFFWMKFFNVSSPF